MPCRSPPRRGREGAATHRRCTKGSVNGTCARAIDDVRHPTSFESRVDACRTPTYIYIYKILCLILWLQRCSGAALACVKLTFSHVHSSVPWSVRIRSEPYSYCLQRPVKNRAGDRSCTKHYSSAEDSWRMAPQASQHCCIKQRETVMYCMPVERCYVGCTTAYDPLPGRPRPRPLPRPRAPLPPTGAAWRFCTSFGVSSTSRVSRLMLSGRMK